MARKSRLFVYGSLKRGGRHHDELLGATSEGAALTRPGYRLVSRDEYPALVSGGNSAVPGEVYLVSGALLSRLDEFEGCPHLYRRAMVELCDGSEAWAYFLGRGEKWVRRESSMVPVRSQEEVGVELRVEARAPIPLDRALRLRFPDASWNRLHRWIRTGKVRVNGRVETERSSRVCAGDRVVVSPSAPRPVAGRRLTPSAVVYADGELVVVDKPPGISTTAYSEERDCLDRLVRELLQNRAPKGVRVGPLGVVHRLDKDTSGLIAFARTMRAKLHLKQQFRSRTTERAYFAIATGRVSSSTLSSRLVADRGDGLRGSTSNPKLGRLAVTHVRTLATNPQATFVKCKLETGRTHQIRIQLFEAGHPLAGERVYTRRLHAPPRARSCVPAPRVMLHAAELGIIHPTSLKPLRFTSPLPADMQKLLKELGLFVPPGALAPNPPG